MWFSIKKCPIAQISATFTLREWRYCSITSSYFFLKLENSIFVSFVRNLWKVVTSKFFVMKYTALSILLWIEFLRFLIHNWIIGNGSMSLVDLKWPSKPENDLIWPRIVYWSVQCEMKILELKEGVCLGRIWATEVWTKVKYS